MLLLMKSKRIQKKNHWRFERAITNATPLLEVVSKRVGGANYQVPREVRPERKFFLSCNWIINAAKSKKENQ